MFFFFIINDIIYRYFFFIVYGLIFVIFWVNIFKLYNDDLGLESFFFVDL